MKIKCLEAQKLSIPWPKKTQSSFGVYQNLNGLFVKMTSTDGLVGYGEAGMMSNHLGESPEVGVELVNNHFSHVLKDVDILDISEIHSRMDRIVDQVHATKSAVDVALYDLIGKHLNIPIYKFLGGCIRKEFPTATGIGYGTTGEMVEEIQNGIQRGYTSFEVKMIGHVKNDLERMIGIMKNIDPSIVLIFDPNEAWSVTDTIELGRKVQDFPNLFYFEGPTHRSHIAGFAQIRRSIGVPIIAHESITSAELTYEVIKNEAADVINVTLTRLGSFKKCQEIMTLAQSAGLNFRIDAPLQTKIGDSAVAHLGAASNHILGALDCHQYLGMDIVEEGGLKIINGNVCVPDGPGLGLVPVAKYR